MRLMISPTATHPDVTAGKQFVFRVAYVDDMQGRVMARFAREELEAESAAVLYDVASAYNRSFAEVFRQGFESRGGRVVSFTSYTTGRGDFRPLLAVIRDSAPDVLVLPNYPTEVTSQVEQARELGLVATLLGGDAWDARLFAGHRDFEGAFYVDSWHPEVDSDESRAFVGAYRARYGSIPSSAAALTYDALGLLFRAIEEQDRLDGETLRRGLVSREVYQGVTGPISFPSGGDPDKSAVIVKISGGRARFHRKIQP